MNLALPSIYIRYRGQRSRALTMTPRRSAVVRYIDAGTNRRAFATGRAADQTQSCDRLRGDLQAPFDSDDAGGGVVNAGTDCSPYPTSDDDRRAGLRLSAVTVSRDFRPGVAKFFADVRRQYHSSYHWASESVRCTASSPTAYASASNPRRSARSRAFATSRETMNSGVDLPTVPNRG